MSLRIDHPGLADIDELLALYFKIYGKTYPIALGTDPAVMAAAMKSEQYLWYVMRDDEHKRIVGSVAFELDLVHKIGKIVALVTHPDYRKRSIAHNLIHTGTERLVGTATSPLNSIYTTTRTNAIAPQTVFLKDGFLPLGIFPNAHKLQQYETLTLMAKFKPGILNARSEVAQIPERVLPLVKASNEIFGCEELPRPLLKSRATPPKTPIGFEIIYAPAYVKRRFEAVFQDPETHFYPFHTPNTICAAKSEPLEIYVYFSPRDRYCTIVGMSESFTHLAGRMNGLIDQLSDFGISYIETLLPLSDRASIETLLEEDFLPTAIYPAMRELPGGKLQDFVLMSHTMEPLNFRGMAIDRSFKPYVDQYVELWKKRHLECLEVFNEYR